MLTFLLSFCTCLISFEKKYPRRVIYEKNEPIDLLFLCAIVDDVGTLLLVFVCLGDVVVGDDDDDDDCLYSYHV